MEQLNRLAIACGAGILAGMALLGTYDTLAGDAVRERAGVAMDRLVPDYTVLDTSVQLSTYDKTEEDGFALSLLFAGATIHTDCGGRSVMDACTVTADLPKALRLTDGYTPVIQNDATLTVGEYASTVGDILSRADTVVTTVDGQQQTVTNEGSAFTVTYLDAVTRHVSTELWQRSLAAIPAAMLWLAAGGVGVIVGVVTSVAIRPTRSPEPDVVEGVEVFDVLDKD